MTSRPTPLLSVVIPAYNEEQRLGGTLSRITTYLQAQQYPWEVIVSDDGSRDGTSDVVRKLMERELRIRLVTNEGNRGKGFAVRQGMQASRGEFLLFSDADLSTPIEEVEELLPWLWAGFDIAIGSRDLPESEIRIRQPWYREGMGKIFNGVVRMMLLPGIADTQCGFKLFRREAAQEIFPRQRVDRFSFDVEILWLARKYGFRIKEVPIVWLNEEHSRVHPIRDGSRMLLDLMRIRLGDWRGYYPLTRASLALVDDAEIQMPATERTP